MNKLLVLVPAYNEEETIADVIIEIKKVKLPKDIVVINDGSADNTYGICKKMKGITLINLPFNLGIGGSVQTGIRYAVENGYDTAVQIDADGQHDPKFLKKLTEALKGNDLIIGSRYIEVSDYKTPFMRRLGIFLFSQIIKLVCGKIVYDTTSGYRVFGKNALEFFSKYYPQEFPEPLSIVDCLKNGLKIKEIKVETRKRAGGTSSITPLYSVYLMISICFAMIFESFRKLK